MTAWTKVVTEPLGLAGFALFLIFAFLGKLKSNDKRRWIAPTAFLCAAGALCGGLGLAYRQMVNETVKVPPPVVQAPVSAPSVKQSSSGPGGINVNGVQGDVVYTYNATTGQTTARKVHPVAPEAKGK